jgi:hypothetical protein
MPTMSRGAMFAPDWALAAETRGDAPERKLLDSRVVAGELVGDVTSHELILSLGTYSAGGR